VPVLLVLCVATKLTFRCLSLCVARSPQQWGIAANAWQTFSLFEALAKNAQSRGATAVDPKKTPVPMPRPATPPRRSPEIETSATLRLDPIADDDRVVTLFRVRDDDGRELMTVSADQVEIEPRS
jgi:hypothetical protein